MKNLLLQLKVWKDQRGQDLIEYALMAGFVAVAAGAIMPGVATSISQIFSKVASVLSSANGAKSQPFCPAGSGRALPRSLSEGFSRLSGSRLPVHFNSRFSSRYFGNKNDCSNGSPSAPGNGHNAISFLASSF